MSGLIEKTDFLVVGAGVAGLRAAVELAEHGQVLILTKESFGESNTHYAQGGIAVALSGAEDVALHLEDTIYAGDGLVYRPAAEALVAEGPLRVEELIEWGTLFDRAAGDPGSGNAGELLMGREAAHSLPRILHANGDATGAEISRSLLAYARLHPRIDFKDWTTISNLVVADGRVVGADLLFSKDGLEGGVDRVLARAVLIASGGAGQVYSDTTNPPVATGDGIALAAKAGAELADMEFYQFHPTALSLPGVPRFLLSEALRGEGAYLRNDQGERFMERYHPLLELAPRDVVARAIAREGMGADGADGKPVLRPVYLDMRHVQEIDLTKRFPGISRFLAGHGLLLHRDLIPVRPAAHYLMGGIRTDLGGRTTLPGLYAAGEVACTGVHGANRLASNSLLEGLVFGARAAKTMLRDGLLMADVDERMSTRGPEMGQGVHAEEIASLVSALRASMFRDAGLLRDAESLRLGGETLAPIVERLAEIASSGEVSRQLIEARSLAVVAGAILVSAEARTESRGAHFRNDFPKREDAGFQKHSVLTSDGVVRFEQW